MNFLGSFVDQSTVKFGSGAGPKLSKVCRYRKEVFVTRALPSIPTPPIDSVTQVGSPENSALYSGVLANFINRSFIIK